MALFTNLFHASSVLSTFLKATVSPSVVVAPPPDTLLTTEEVRVSLMYVMEHPSHRNDGLLRNADGSGTSPPITLSIFFMITTYGEAPTKDADGAHRLLGEVAKAFHDKQVLDLAALAIPPALGEGKLNTSLVPMTPDLMEKLFSPLQIKHRPFLLYEVWPVQIKSALPPTSLGAVVSPLGINLSGPTARSRPVISRIVPARPAEDAFIRIDGPFGAAADTVAVGTNLFTVLSGAVVPVDPAEPDRGVRLQLPIGTIAPGTHKVTVSSGQLTSEAYEIQVQSTGAWMLDGPPAFSHSQGSGALTLTGQGLSNVVEVYFWPDRGIFDPSDVKPFTAASVTATSLDVTPTGLASGVYRVAARLDMGVGIPVQFTPFIVLEIEP